MSTQERTTIALTAAALVLCASVGLFAAGGDEPAQPAPSKVAAATRETPPGAPAAAPESLRIDLLNRAGQAVPQRDPFTPRGWRTPAPPPPPQAPAAVEPPPAPTAPALPFTFMGQFESPGEKTVYYLVEGDRLHAVTQGETINGTYRVEVVDGSRMDILYLPLAIVQTLAVGAPQ